MLFSLRGEGCSYAAFLLDRPHLEVRAEASCEKGAIPSVALVMEDSALRERVAPGAVRGQVWVVAFPTPCFDCHVCLLLPGGDLMEEVTLPLLKFKLQSRLFATRNPQVAQAIRGMELSRIRQGGLVGFDAAWPSDGDTVVWRATARLPMANGQAPGGEVCVRVLDQEMSPLSGAQVLVMEDHVVPSDRVRGGFDHLIALSVRAPHDYQRFVVTVSCGTACTFGCLYPGLAGRLLWRAGWMVEGAWGDPNYERWFAYHRASAQDLIVEQQMASGKEGLPLISVVVPTCHASRSYLEGCIRSVLAQAYPRWELVVVNSSPDNPGVTDALAGCPRDSRVRVLEMAGCSAVDAANGGDGAARGDYVAFLDASDQLEPDALWCYWRELCDHPEADLLYCDEDFIRDGGLCCPTYKCMPSLTKLYAYNYVGHLLMVSRRALNLVGRTDYDVLDAWDYDLTLKVFEVAREVRHVPRVLYHQRKVENFMPGGNGAVKHDAHKAGGVALGRHLARRHLAATVEDGPLPCTYRVCYQIPTPAPKVSVIIPSRDHAPLLRICVESIIRLTNYPGYEVVVVENGSEDPATFALYGELSSRDQRVRVVTWRPAEGEEAGFNYSALVNFGAAQATGDVLVFLNNDTDVISQDWLSELVGVLQRGEVGVVGAKLVFPDGLVQHAGMYATADQHFAHLNQNMAVDALGYAYDVGLPRDFSMVTGACQAVRRDVFQALGGYDEGLAVAFNDGDFCLRAREAGYAVAYTPYALLHHREFSSRGREASDPRLRARYLAEQARLVARHPEFFAEGDPAMNPNLDRYKSLSLIWHDEPVEGRD